MISNTIYALEAEGTLQKLARIKTVREGSGAFAPLFSANTYFFIIGGGRVKEEFILSSQLQSIMRVAKAGSHSRSLEQKLNQRAPVKGLLMLYLCFAP